ncbi:ABC transporter permease [Haladaptatus sp. R4]|uniref:ABC transporter permease n=1 Tax=Haladaptatus sp. R4 TaxID=1679489 RepID=UPI0007B48E9B|nr:ABC transporter permease [Haladaptatus sp. R4]KZN26275.1 ABC transporter permease [Haladaptatus sp. R4]
MNPIDDSEKPTTRTDGGTSERSRGGIDDSIFTQMSNVPELTTREKARRSFERRIYAPTAVLLDDWRALVGSLILLGFVAIAIVAIEPFGIVLVSKATVMEGPIFIPPFQDWAYPLGTNVYGKSILKQVVHAAPAMLEMILAGALLSVCLGTIIGTVAGYRGGRTDSALMTLTDVVLTIPGLALVIVLASIYQPEQSWVVGLILGIDNWPKLARTIRSQVLSIREESFTEASRIMGLSEFHILRKDVISNLMPYISVNFANSARSIIFESVALYFLHILPQSNLNWGIMMQKAYNNANLTNPNQIHWLLIPMIFIILISLGFILLAQGLDRVFNVRLRARHESAGGDE